jgi:hypothetical protein
MQNDGIADNNPALDVTEEPRLDFENSQVLIIGAISAHWRLKLGRDRWQHLAIRPAPQVGKEWLGNNYGPYQVMLDGRPWYGYALTPYGVKVDYLSENRSETVMLFGSFVLDAKGG